MRSKESDRVKALSLLKKDLINGPRHCFGIHTHCSPDFCTKVTTHSVSCGQTCDAAPQTTNCDLSESNASNIDTFQSPQNSVSSRTHLNRTILQSSRTDLEDEQLISSETGDRECINNDEDLEGK